jgi:hypothetical protein
MIFGNYLGIVNAGRDAILNLFIDDGQESEGRPQRKNLMDPEFNRIGIANCQTSSGLTLIVIDYASEYETNSDGRSLGEVSVEEISNEEVESPLVRWLNEEVESKASVLVASSMACASIFIGTLAF